MKTINRFLFTISVVLFVCSVLQAQDKVVNPKQTLIPKPLGVTVRYASGTLGNYFQTYPAAFNTFTVAEKQSITPYLSWTLTAYFTKFPVPETGFRPELAWFRQLYCKTLPAKCIFPDATTVTTRTDNVGNGVQIKLYRRQGLTRAEVKGIVLLGSSNDYNDPHTGLLDDVLINALCEKLALDNFIGATVAYRDEPVKVGNPPVVNFGMLATDFNNALNYIISNYGGTRSKAVLGGLEYAGSAIAYSATRTNSPLLGISGVVAVRSSLHWQDTQTMQVPLAFMTTPSLCADGMSPSQIYPSLPAPIKAKSICTDAVPTPDDWNCGSPAYKNAPASAEWLNFFYNRIKIWIP